MNVLFALDSFKGCLSSKDACEAAMVGLRAVDYGRCMPVSDGGEGLVDVLVTATGGTRVKADVRGPWMEPLRAEYGRSQDGETAFVEVAAASGLALVERSRRNPLFTTSFGTGELMREALMAGAHHLILGLGGSATNDAGLGILQALGFRLQTANGTFLSDGATGADLKRVARIVPPDTLPEFTLTAPCDVRAPLYGPLGAARVFAPQKGATETMVEELDEGLRQCARLWPKEVAETPGAGAAGGIGAGIMACLGAKLVPGIELVLDTLRLDEALQGVDWVVTGEGHSDAQTLMGKVALGVAERAHRKGVRVALVSGGISDEEQLRTRFDAVLSINPQGMELKEAMKPETAKRNLAATISAFLQTQME